MTFRGSELLKKWYDNMQEREDAHIKAYNRFKNYDSAITLPIIVLSSISSSLSFVSISEDCRFSLFGFFSGCLNVIITILTTIKEYYLWNKKSYSHKDSYQAYKKIKNTIQIHIAEHKLGDTNKTYRQIISNIGSLIAKIETDAPALPIDLEKTIKKLDLDSIGMLNNDTDIKTASIMTLASESEYINNMNSENEIDVTKLGPIETFNNNTNFIYTEEIKKERLGSFDSVNIFDIKKDYSGSSDDNDDLKTTENLKEEENYKKVNFKLKDNEQNV